MINIWAKTLPELEKIVTDGGFPRYRARQLRDYLYKRFVFDFSEMKQLPANMREWLQKEAVIDKPEIVKEQTSFDGNTTKILLRLADGSFIETVCMHHNYGNSICISTQVGCAMGCIFCASTQKGLERNLTAGEMLAQMYAFREVNDAPIHSLVLMGSGEPLHNYEEVLHFLHLVHDPELLNISYRNMTLSTCGIVPQIYRLADEGIPITLAISLHAPNDRIRNRILPSSRRFAIQDVVKAADYYFKKTGRRVTFEYILIHGINDSVENAEELNQLTKGLACHFNLIPINGTEHIKLYPPSLKEIQKFQNVLLRHGRSATVRKQMGDEIQAACGQLKRRYLSDASSKQTNSANNGKIEGNS
jgi:23S rRNA (adenine2503-C2)-methyltransferase